jgi:hypothetical protein
MIVESAIPVAKAGNGPIAVKIMSKAEPVFCIDPNLWQASNLPGWKVPRWQSIEILRILWLWFEQALLSNRKGGIAQRTSERQGASAQGVIFCSDFARNRSRSSSFFLEAFGLFRQIAR